MVNERISKVQGITGLQEVRRDKGSTERETRVALSQQTVAQFRVEVGMIIITWGCAVLCMLESYSTV
jgi:hypothetical protein